MLFMRETGCGYQSTYENPQKGRKAAADEDA